MSTKLKTKSKARVIGRFHSVSGAYKAGIRFADYRDAKTQEILGPHFKPLLWVGNKAYVKLTAIEIEERKRAAAFVVAPRDSKPNLQNIPVRTEEGDRIITAFKSSAIGKTDPAVFVGTDPASNAQAVIIEGDSISAAAAVFLAPPPAEINIDMESIKYGTNVTGMSACDHPETIVDEACIGCIGEPDALVNAET